jgi:hypothetical protein
MKFEIRDVDSEELEGPREGVAGPEGCALVSSLVLGNFGSWVR